MTNDNLSRGFYDWRESLLGSQLPAMTKLVLLVIHTHMNTKTNAAFPSYDTIAKEASLSRRAVITHIKTAVAEGWMIKEIRTRNDGSQTSNNYLMTDPNQKNQVGKDFRVGGESDAPPQCTSFTPPVHDVHPNSQSNNPSEEKKSLQQKTTKKGLQSRIDALSLSEMGVVEEWNEFLEHRKALKAPMTDLAQQKALKRLAELKEQGSDPKAVLSQSIVNGWKGLFPEKTGGHQNETHQPANRRYASGRAIGEVKRNLAKRFTATSGEEIL